MKTSQFWGFSLSNVLLRSLFRRPKPNPLSPKLTQQIWIYNFITWHLNNSLKTLLSSRISVTFYFFEHPVPSWHWNSILSGKQDHQLPNKASKMDPGSVPQLLYIYWPAGSWGFLCIWLCLFFWAAWSKRSGTLEQNSHKTVNITVSFTSGRT